MPHLIKNPKIKIFIQWSILVILVGILLIAVYVFISNFEALRRGGFMRAHIRRQSIGQKINPDQIRGWMTFRYINLVFNLPPSYLQSALNIKDTRYPNLALDALAREQNAISADLAARTANIVKNFHP